MATNHEVFINPARYDALPEIAHIAWESWFNAFGKALGEADLAAERDSRSEAAFRRVFDRDLLLVASREAQVCGFLQLRDDDNGLDLYVEKLYVATDCQGTGIGRQLLQAAFDWAGDRALELDVWDQNTRAIALYESEGFRVVGEKTFTLPSGAPTSPDLIMRREPDHHSGEESP